MRVCTLNATVSNLVDSRDHQMDVFGTVKCTIAVALVHRRQMIGGTMKRRQLLRYDV